MRRFALTASILGLIFLVGEGCSTIPRPGSWTLLGNGPELASVQAFQTLADGRILAIGYAPAKARFALGAPAASLYSPNDGSWRAAAPPPHDPAEATLTLLRNGSLLLAGGTLGGAALKTAYLYVPAQDRWTPTASMRDARSRHTATLLADGRVLVVGGADGTAVRASCEVYDPQRQSWSPASDLPLQRFGHRATLMADGRVIVTGGNSAIDSTRSGGGPAGFGGEFPIDTDVVFDPRSGRWSNLVGPIPVEDPNVLALPDGALFITGGHFGVQPSPSAYVFNPRNGQWTEKTNPKASDPAPILLQDGRILFLGGGLPWLYYPDQDLWLPGTAPRSGNIGFIEAKVGLPSGQVLVATSLGVSSLQIARFDPAGYPELPGSHGALASGALASALAVTGFLLLAILAVRYLVTSRGRASK